MLSAYLTVCNCLKQFKDEWALNTKNINKIGRNKSDDITIPDKATSEITKKNNLKITFSSDQIKIEYFNGKTLDVFKLTEGSLSEYHQYKSAWNWEEFK